MRSFKLVISVLIASAILGCSDSEQSSIPLIEENSTVETEDFDFEKMMEEFTNRPILEVLTIEAIDSTEDDDLIQLVFDNLSLKIEDDYENSHLTISKLSPGRQAIYAIWLVDIEVNNGGFNQFYFNRQDYFAESAASGFELIGANEYAELMKRANKIYKEQELGERQDGTIEGFSESYEDNPLNALDSEFYNISEDLVSLQVQFIRKNKEQFID